MENASKALLIGASTLIAVLIISVATYLFKSASGVSKTYFNRQEATEISEFNAHFSKFTSAGVQDENGKVTKQYATIYDIISLANFAYDYNSKILEEPDNPNSYKDDSAAVQINLTIEKNTYKNIESEKSLNVTYNYLLTNYYYINKERPTADNYYTFQANISSNNTGRINKVDFTQFSE